MCRIETPTTDNGRTGGARENIVWRLMQRRSAGRRPSVRGVCSMTDRLLSRCLWLIVMTLIVAVTSNPPYC